MAHFIGKSGADAILKRHKEICRILGSYHDKFLLAVDTAEAAGVITSDEKAQIYALVAAADVYCAILQKVADNSGFAF